MPGDPQIRRFDGPARSAQADTDAWLAAAPLAAPLRATCDAVCPASPASPACAPPTCSSTATPLLAEFGTPSETLIPPETWNASPRGTNALLREPRGPLPLRLRRPRSRSRAEDACLADALAAEVARFYQ